jgi:DNA-3-methyladenine glycosylase II
MSQRSFSITPIPPFRLDLTAWALRRRPENAIDRWDGMIYRRVLMIDSHAIEVAVHQSGGSEASQLNVDMTGALTRREDEFARTLFERMLGAIKTWHPFTSWLRAIQDCSR